MVNDQAIVSVPLSRPVHLAFSVINLLDFGGEIEKCTRELAPQRRGWRLCLTALTAWYLLRHADARRRVAAQPMPKARGNASQLNFTAPFR